ncbi:membrane integrity-associated transporter subunit PqiC [Halomonas aquamarina]|uniref:Membrane integrity-associated transporter subunit PqiC n=1 Tax=Vreelandella aquamarina TaxID=77097 RepID=A0ACC5VU12_9GAMM|nr:ABC-type transport auxiliary lipoprotein family protein [Halomonas aquamarina]MBZ5487788.1 membrane integrity-associated transporter subunit PqiC [Halomonas aquamarina]
MKVRHLAIVLTSLALMLSAGCSILPENDPPTLYRLPALDEAHASTSTASSRMDATQSATKRLGVAAPEAGYLLSSSRIVVYPENTQVKVYEGARWHEDTPELLQARLIDGLQQSGLYAGVGSDHLPSDLLLLSELRHFQSVYENGRPSAVIQLDVQLVEADSRASIGSQSFRTSSQAADVEIPAVVDAFGRASDTLVEQLTAWLSEQRTGVEARN